MISKSQIKLIAALGQKKYRKRYGTFIAEGTKLALELLGSSLEITNIYATPDWIAEYRPKLAPRHINILEDCLPADLSKISQLSSAQEVLLVAKIPDNDIQDIHEEEITLLLENIRDPGNLGTIIRLADWYGLGQIICSPGCVDAYSPKVVQATMGSIARVKVIYAELGPVIKEKKLYTYAACMQAEISIHKLSTLENRAALLIGNEGAGISADLMALASTTISIPAFGSAESLNAAMATGILLDNIKRIADR